MIGKKYYQKLLPDEIYVIKDNTIYTEPNFKKWMVQLMKNYKLVILKRSNIKNFFFNLIMKLNILHYQITIKLQNMGSNVSDYIISVNCSYYFEYLPLHKIGLPVPNGN